MSELNRLHDIEDVYDEAGHHIGRVGTLPSGDLKLFTKAGPNGFLPVSDRHFRESERESAKHHIAVTVRRAKPTGRRT